MCIPGMSIPFSEDAPAPEFCHWRARDINFVGHQALRVLVPTGIAVVAGCKTFAHHAAHLDRPNCPVPVIMGSVLGGRGMSISPIIAIPSVPMAMAEGAARAIAWPRARSETPMKFCTLWPMAFMV
jgi:hypothetical protein